MPEQSKDKNNGFAFQRANYMLMLVGIAIIALGFIIMALDATPLGFGVLGLTVGPIIVMLGFLFEFFAILYKPKQ